MVTSAQNQKAPRCLKKIRQFLFQEEKVDVLLPSELLGKNTFVPIESRYRGFDINAIKDLIVIKRSGPVQAIFGSPIYSFVGQRMTGSPHQEKILVPGTVSVRPLIRYFLCLWFGSVFLFLAVCCLYMMFLAGHIILSNTMPDTHQLTNIAGIFGGGLIVLTFGIIGHFLLKFLSGFERIKLLRFCMDLGQKQKN